MIRFILVILTAFLYLILSIQQVAVDFFKYREAQQTKVDPAAADKKDGAYPV